MWGLLSHIKDAIYLVFDMTPVTLFDVPLGVYSSWVRSVDPDPNFTR